VTIPERDDLPAMGAGRKGVPQGRHAHVMLASAQRSIKELLPVITGELSATGAQGCKSLRDIRLVVAGHELNRDAVGAMCCSSPAAGRGSHPAACSRTPQ
jgi:hypothetical protein